MTRPCCDDRWSPPTFSWPRTFAVVVPVADERTTSAAWAVELAVVKFAAAGIRIERLLTDNGASYRGHAYRDTLARLEIRHKRTRPFRSCRRRSSSTGYSAAFPPSRYRKGAAGTSSMMGAARGPIGLG